MVGWSDVDGRRVVSRMMSSTWSLDLLRSVGGTDKEGRAGDVSLPPQC